MNTFSLAANNVTGPHIDFNSINRDDKVIATSGDIDVGLKLTIYQLPNGWGEIEVTTMGKKASTVLQCNRNILTEYMNGELDNYIDMTVNFLVQ